MRALIATYAWLLARLPEGFARANAGLLGLLLWRLRRRVIRGNLRAAFPDRDEAWVRRIGRLSCRRAAEMGLFSIVSPRLGEEEIRSRIRVHGSLLAGEARVTADVGGAVLFVPHFTLMEMMTVVTLAAPALGGRPWVTLYRPLNQPAADAWVKAARERFGMRLASRREGFGVVMRNVREGGVSCILFDQKVWAGVRLAFLGRPAAVTNLPGLVAQRHQAAARVFWAERTGFWRCELRTAVLRSTDAAGLTRESNAWLEARLRSSDEACADWLWAHDRWRDGDSPRHDELGD
jgi:lauroyl/myristoyl acyltransferase